VEGDAGVRLSLATSVLVHYGIRDAIELAAAAGYDAVDVWGGRPHVYRRDYSGRELRALRATLADRGLEAISFMPAFYRYPHSLSNPHQAVREDSLNYMRECINNAVELGCPVVLLVPGRTLFGQSADDARSRLLDSIDQLCRYAEDLPILLALEAANPMVTDLVNTGEDALAIARALGHQSLRVVLDTGHMNIVGEAPPRTLHAVGAMLAQVHVNDNDGYHQQNLIPGRGTFDFPGLAKDLKDSGYSGALTVELSYEYAGDPYPAIAEARRWLSELVTASGLQ
jgi:protein FrlC